MKTGVKVVLSFTALLQIGSIIAQNETDSINPNGFLEWSISEKFRGVHKNTLGDPEAHPLMSGAIDQPISTDNNNDAEIHAAINPYDTSNIVVSPIREDATTHALTCPIFYTKDFGQTWKMSSYKNMPHKGTGIQIGGGDPLFSYDSKGKLYFTWVEQNIASQSATSGKWGCYWASSTDGGATWQEESINTVLEGTFAYPSGKPSTPVADKEWMAIDRNPASPYLDNVYVAFVTMSVPSSKTLYQIECNVKPAANNNFNASTVVIANSTTFKFAQFPCVDVDKNGNVHVIFIGSKDNTTFSVYYSVSKDGAKTFSNPAKISDFRFKMAAVFGTSADDEITGVNPQRAYPAPYLSADPINGNLYVVWTAFGISSKLTNGADIYYSRSTDGGTTWSAPKILNDDPTGKGVHNYYANLSVNKYGRLVISWYDRRDDTGNIKAHYYYTESTDGGLTFSANKAASSVQTDFSKVGLTNGNFGVGEYNQVVASKNFTIPFWTDGRDNNGDLDVYAAFIADPSLGFERISVVSDKFSLKEITPNPAGAEITISFLLTESNTVSVEIFDIAGKRVKYFSPTEAYLGASSVKLNIEDVSTGSYFIKVNTSYGYSIKRIVKE